MFSLVPQGPKQYKLNVSLSDDGASTGDAPLTSFVTITVNISDANDIPVVNSSTSVNMPENLPVPLHLNGIALAVFTTFDEDPADVLRSAPYLSHTISVISGVLH